MSQDALQELVTKAGSLRSDMEIEYGEPSSSIVFSNTGRRGDSKQFSITLPQLVGLLEDIKNNLHRYAGHESYIEGDWRALFSSTVSDKVTNALAGTQTLPTFTALSKVIHVANGLPATAYMDRRISLQEAYLDRAIAVLGEIARGEYALLETLKTQEKQISSSSAIQDGRNVIYCGAPGTGKSYEITQEIGSCKHVRTIFHPDTQYTDFVGSLRPTMLGNGQVGYSFRPGPFTNALILALSNPSESVFLVVEEINRASAAAVFGEIFQLLDRNSDGSSCYQIDFVDADMLNYINQELRSTESSELQHGKLGLPPNLSILATMNSNDQAVMPMDAAFKRRWEFQYLPIDYAKAPLGQCVIPSETGPITCEWALVAKAINTLLSSENIPEDRLLGHRFFAEHELHADNIKGSLRGKLFMYLWDDVLRHRNRELIFRSSVDGSALTTFGQLSKAFDDGKAVFSEALEQELRRLSLSIDVGQDVIEAEGQDSEV